MKDLDLLNDLKLSHKELKAEALKYQNFAKIYSQQAQYADSYQARQSDVAKAKHYSIRAKQLETLI